MSDDPMFDDEAWDEEQWEAFLRDNDRRVDRYMELMFRFMEEYPRPDPEDREAFEAWKNNLRAFLQQKGWRRDDLGLPFLWLGDEEDEDEEAERFFDAGDSFMDEDPPEEDVYDVENIPVYRQAVGLSTYVLDWAHALPGDLKDTTLVHFCSHIMQIPANIARGHGIGLDRHSLGGNIACAKRGLVDANAALELLRRMKYAPYMDQRTYRHLYERTYEVRNALGIYIQYLRDRFNLGID